MRRTNRKAMILCTLLFLALLLPGIMIAQPTNQELFNQVRTFHLTAMPVDLVSHIQGDLVTRTIADIPRDEIINPRKPIEVKFFFIRGVGQAIKLCNVSELYRDRLTTYIVLMDNAKAFLDPNITWNNFNRIYTWDFVRERGDYYIVRFTKRSQSNVFFLVYISKQYKTVNRIARFEDNQASGEVTVRYSKHRQTGIYFPTQFSGWGLIENPQTGSSDRKDFDISLAAPLRINTGLSNDCFLNDDCLCRQ